MIITKKKIAFIKLCLLISAVILIPPILYFSCRDTLFNTEWLEDLPKLLKDNPIETALALILMQAVQIVFCFLPGQPIQLASSFLFGNIIGYLISIFGAIIGSIIAFYIAKILGSEATKIIFGEEKVEKYKNKLNSARGLFIVLLLYLIPGFPKDLITYAAGISRMDPVLFLAVSSIGRTPPMLGSIFIGSFLQSENYTAIAIITAVCGAVLLICFIKRKKIIELIDKIESKKD